MFNDFPYKYLGAETCVWRYSEFIPLKTRNDGIHEQREMPEKHFAKKRYVVFCCSCKRKCSKLFLKCYYFSDAFRNIH